MKNTYWNNCGKYEAYANALRELVPDQGEAECKHVDRFRRAANAYYDVYNNGGGNSVTRKVAYFFPRVMGILIEGRRWRRYRIDWDAVAEITEPRMDEIIEKVAKKLGPINGVNLND